MAEKKTPIAHAQRFPGKLCYFVFFLHIISFISVFVCIAIYMYIMAIFSDDEFPSPLAYALDKLWVPNITPKMKQSLCGDCFTVYSVITY